MRGMGGDRDAKAACGIIADARIAQMIGDVGGNLHAFGHGGLADDLGDEGPPWLLEDVGQHVEAATVHAPDHDLFDAVAHAGVEHDVVQDVEAFRAADAEQLGARQPRGQSGLDAWARTRPASSAMRSSSVGAAPASCSARCSIQRRRSRSWTWAKSQPIGPQ